jgi:hypothetical protein
VIKKTTAGWRRWLMFFIAACLVSLVWSVPASVLPRLLVWSGVNNSSGEALVQVSRTRGRLWAGRAESVLIRNNQQTLVLENMEWRLSWRDLLAAKLCLQISTNNDELTINGETCINTAGVVSVSDMVFELPAAALVSGQLAGAALIRSLDSSVQVQGVVSGIIEALTWQPAQQQLSVSARGLWDMAAVALQLPDPQSGRMRLQTLRLHQLPWTLTSRGADQVFLQVQGADTPADTVDLRVQAESEIWLDGRFITRLQVSVQESTPQLLRDMLMIIAEPQQAGVYQLVWRSSGA